MSPDPRRGALPMLVGGTTLGVLSACGLVLVLRWTPPSTSPLPPKGAPNVVEGRVVEGPQHVGPFALRFTCAEIVLSRQISLKSRTKLGAAMAGDCVLGLATDHGTISVDATTASRWFRLMGPTRNEHTEPVTSVTEVPELSTATFDTPPTAPLFVDVNAIVPGQSIVVQRDDQGKTERIWLDGRAELDAHFAAKNVEEKRVFTYATMGGLFAALALVLIGRKVRAKGWEG